MHQAAAVSSPAPRTPPLEGPAPAQALAVVKVPAHRPSRRSTIIDAAVRVFAGKGYTDTSIQDIAKAADVVPTAVYYHFSGKDALFDVALSEVLGRVDEVVDAARGAVVTRETLPAVIAAVWSWIEANPDEARILYTHLPGATEQARLLRADFEERHIARALDYLPPGEAVRPVDPVEQAVTMLAVRTLIALLMNIHPLRLDGGPLARRSPKALRRALEEVSVQLVRGPAVQDDPAQ